MPGRLYSGKASLHGPHRLTLSRQASSTARRGEGWVRGYSRPSTHPQRDLHSRRWGRRSGAWRRVLRAFGRLSGSTVKLTRLPEDRAASRCDGCRNLRSAFASIWRMRLCAKIELPYDVLQRVSVFIAHPMHSRVQFHFFHRKPRDGVGCLNSSVLFWLHRLSCGFVRLPLAAIGSSA